MSVFGISQDSAFVLELQQETVSIHKLVIQRRLVVFVLLKNGETDQRHHFVLNMVIHTKFLGLLFILWVVQQELSVFSGCPV